VDLVCSVPPHVATPVVVVTAVSEERSLGTTGGAFTSLSLDLASPPARRRPATRSSISMAAAGSAATWPADDGLT
jgi:hypothetical protein